MLHQTKIIKFNFVFKVKAYLFRLKIKKGPSRRAGPFGIGRTVSRFLFYSVIYLLDLPPGKRRAALLSLRTFRYTWSFWPWCRHHRMSPYDVVSSYLAVSPLPCGGLFSVTACIKLLPSVLSTAGCPFQSGLSSGASTSDRSSYLYLNELFLVTELALKFVILCVDLLNSLHKAWSYVLAAFVTLH